MIQTRMLSHGHFLKQSRWFFHLTNNNNNNKNHNPNRFFTKRRCSSQFVKTAKIINLSDPFDDANSSLHNLPYGDSAQIISSGLESHHNLDLLHSQNANVIFVSHPLARKPLAEIIRHVPSIEWVHARSAGVDFMTSEELNECADHVTFTNAKGQFSSTLAEYAMMACAHFAKDVPRLMRQKEHCEWGKFNVRELRGATLGIIGYGDIGRECARLAKAYGMHVIGLRRNPKKSEGDEFCDHILGSDHESIKRIMSESNYILVSAPLTKDTKGMIGRKEFEFVRNENVVFINLGRGPIVDESALIDALKSGVFEGAALDVFVNEPLPSESELWNLPNVLISPHNMDQTATFMHEATEFFVHKNLMRFLRNDLLENIIDIKAGY